MNSISQYASQQSLLDPPSDEDLAIFFSYSRRLLHGDQFDVQIVSTSATPLPTTSIVHLRTGVFG